MKQLIMIFIIGVAIFVGIYYGVTEMQKSIQHIDQGPTHNVERNIFGDITYVILMTIVVLIGPIYIFHKREKYYKKQ